eukprot:scaffold133273_cov71-Phaeocystis_antarctica.AAC.5
MAHSYLMRSRGGQSVDPRRVNSLASWRPKNWGYNTLSCDGLSVRGSVSGRGSLQHGQSAVLAVPSSAVPSSDRTPPQGALGGSGRFGTPKAKGRAPGRPATALGARQPPSKPPKPPPLII